MKRCSTKSSDDYVSLIAPERAEIVKLYKGQLPIFDNLQESLGPSLGLSSLGRAGPHVLANLDKVQGLLHSLIKP